MEFLTLPFMQQALAVSLLLAVLLGYFGWHVVLRRIVFVDLALAQISALGIAFAILLDQSLTLFALAFTLVAAGILSLITEGRRVPSEAKMGIVYAVASAASIVVISRTPHGEADVLKVMFGDILATPVAEVWRIAVIFIIIGIVHAVLVRPMIRLTETIAEHGKPHDNRARVWNLVFYLTLALAIAFAIRSGGVLLVFSYLIIAPVTGMVVSPRPLVVLLVAWVCGALASVGGMGLSYHFDLSPGPTIVVCLGALLLVVTGAAWLAQRGKAPAAVGLTR